MNHQILEENIRGLIEEQQLKLGYERETVRLYYPLESLNHLTESACTADEMQAALEIFAMTVRDRFGVLEISHNEKGRFCIAVPEEGNEYVHQHLHENPFLAELIETVRQHGATMEQVLSVFQKYSTQVHVQELDNGEFQYLVYFEDGKPDDYRYCLAQEGHHVIYHRYAPSDYVDFGF